MKRGQIGRVKDKQNRIWEKKRAAICGVAAMQPEIMLLDEPSAQLDPRGKRELADLLNSFKQTKIISTHDMQFARSVCNTAIVLDCGKLAARGNIDEILQIFKKKAVASIGRKAVLTNFFGFLALIGLFFYYGRHGNN